jgi:hypothetical protein
MPRCAAFLTIPCFARSPQQHAPRDIQSQHTAAAPKTYQTAADNGHDEHEQAPVHSSLMANYVGTNGAPPSELADRESDSVDANFAQQPIRTPAAPYLANQDAAAYFLSGMMGGGAHPPINVQHIGPNQHQAGPAAADSAAEPSAGGEDEWRGSVKRGKHQAMPVQKVTKKLKV